MCMWLQGQGIEAAAGTESWCAGQAVSAVEPGHRALAEAKSAQGAGVAKLLKQEDKGLNLINLSWRMAVQTGSGKKKAMALDNRITGIALE